MIDQIVDWAIKNWIEITGSVFGIAYVFLSIRQNILTWLLGFLTSVLYIYVFFVSKFYADMALQFYYVWVSIYGWIIWSKGKTTDHGREVLPVVRTTRKQVVVLAGISALLWVAIYFILKNFTDSPVPIGDAFATALSIVATWMLARKLLEHWLVWIVVDFVSILLFLYKGLYPTVVLFIIYTLAAGIGFWEWKKDMLKHETERLN